MTLTTPYSATFIVGDGETKVFSYLFEEVSESFISVIVYNSLTGQSSTPTYIVDTDQKQIMFGEETPAPTADETVCIYRNTPNVQDTPFRTLQGYDAKALENILSKIVAMIQEIKSNYFTTQVLQGDPWQLDLLKASDDGATVNIDYTAKKLVKGLYFKITDGNLQVSADGSSYITMPKSDDIAEFRQVSITLEDLSVIKKLQYRVGNEWFDAETNAQATADEALALAQTVQGALSSHVSDTNNPHDTSVANLKDTNITNPVNGQYMMFDGLKWKNVYSSATASWGTILGNIADQTDLKDALDAKVNIDGTSIMTAPLKFRAGSMRGAVGPYLNGVSFWKLDSQGNITNIANLTDSQFLPVTTNAIDLGRSANKWKDLYLAGKVYVATINNGGDLVVPAVSGTLATKADVDLAANSGRMITDQGVWYAKMYAATVAPAADDDTNYADFSQTDGQGNPIIVTYTRTNGVWVQDQTITPPAEYDGYVPITSKIWDIAEQAGQQGGRILWNHQSKEFTPYPQMISFENAALTGTPTAPTLNASSPSDQIVNKQTLENALANLDVPELFDWKWKDCTTSRTTWALSDGNWVTGKTDAYQHLVNEYNSQESVTNPYVRISGVDYCRYPLLNSYGSTYQYAYAGLFTSDGEDIANIVVVYTDTEYPTTGHSMYSDPSGSTLVGNITTSNIGTHTYKLRYLTAVPNTQYYLSYYPVSGGHKIVLADQESNVSAIYTATGVAWYYILDTANQRFKLPRTKHNKYAGTLGVVGNGMTLGITDGTNNYGVNSAQSGGYGLRPNNNSYGTNVGTTDTVAVNIGKTIGITTDATKSGIVAQQTQDTGQYKYLYFYVGN